MKGKDASLLQNYPENTGIFNQQRVLRESK